MKILIAILAIFTPQRVNGESPIAAFQCT
uniref:Uncharacterized protein n=1 Tax=Anguilla anguilla TaxID=7936 RepID=A0A0E9SW21_ANGAN